MRRSYKLAIQEKGGINLSSITYLNFASHFLVLLHYYFNQFDHLCHITHLQI